MSLERTEVTGWGPDYTEVQVVCMEGSCPWEYVWDRAVPLAEMVRVAQEHIEREHRGE